VKTELENANIPSSSTWEGTHEKNVTSRKKWSSVSNTIERSSKTSVEMVLYSQ
jgi:hypothetical protein